MGRTVPAASALGNAAANSSALTVPSIRNFSISASSASTTESMSCWRAALASTGQVFGILSGGSSRQMTALKSGPTASGTLNRTQFLPKLAWMASTSSVSGIVFSASSLLTTMARERPFLVASAIGVG